MAIAADPSLAEVLDPLLDARGHLYRAFPDIDRSVKVEPPAALSVRVLGFSTGALEARNVRFFCLSRVF